MAPHARRNRLASVARTLAFGTLLVGACQMQAPQASAQITGRDFDHDGLTDDFETNHTGTLWGVADTDSDLLTDGEEINTYHTDPRNPDSDRDSFWDGQEVKYTHTDPKTDDTDHDGFTELEEHNAGTDPTNANSVPAPAQVPDPVDPVPVPGDGGGDQGGERPDQDQDGLYDDDETEVYGTDPGAYDSDGDNVGDGEEVFNNTDPLNGDDF